MKPSIHITVNEQARVVEKGCTLHALRDALRPMADVLVLNGFPTLEDRVLEEGDQVALIQRGVIPSPEELESFLTARHTPGVHAALKDASVGIAGLGGLGSSVAVALARSGIGHLVLVDYDVVEPSNLNRQQYFVDQLGILKTEALKTSLKRIHPGLRCTLHNLRLTRQNIPSLYEGVDILVEAFDGAEDKAMLVEAACAAKPPIPVVVASGMAGYAPSNLITTRQITAGLISCGDDVNEARPGQGLMAPRVGIAAHHQANAVLRFLLGLPADEQTSDLPLQPKASSSTSEEKTALQKDRS